MSASESAIEERPECGTLVNMFVNDRCWNTDCDHEWGDGDV